MTNTARNLVLTLLLAAAPTVAHAGSIRAVVSAPEAIRKVTAIDRKQTNDGVVTRSYDGKLDGDKLVIDGLPDEGNFDLHFEMESGVVEGWDTIVPPSNDEPPSPMTSEHKRQVLEKLEGVYRAGFPHEVTVLDIRGNAQNAAILTTSLRRGGVVSTSVAANEWIWRVDRHQYENPEDHTWTPYQEHAQFAMERRRLDEPRYAKLAILYDGRLGGIRLDAKRPAADLGKIQLTKPRPGIHAVNADGSPTRETVIKPKPAKWPEDL